MKKPADGSREAVAVGTVSGRAYIAWIDANEATAIVDVTVTASDRGDILRLSFGPSQSVQTLIETPGNEFYLSGQSQWPVARLSERRGGRPEVHVLDLTRTGALAGDDRGRTRTALVR